MMEEMANSIPFHPSHLLNFNKAGVKEESNKKV
jgi:hypothetical protein